MAGSNVSAVVNYVPTVNEGFTTTLGSTISSGATTVPLAGVTGLTNGTVFVGIIEPGATNQQVFTGTVDTGGSQITGVKWTRGTNVGHTGGVSIVDYVTGTAFNMIAAGFLKQHTQTGSHHALTTDSFAASGNATVGGTLGVTGATTLVALVLNGALTGTGLGAEVATTTNSGTAGGTMNSINLAGLKMAWGLSATSGALATNGTSTASVVFPTSFFSAAPTVSVSASSATGDSRVMAVSQGDPASTGFSITFQGLANSSGATVKGSWIAIGT